MGILPREEGPCLVHCFACGFRSGSLTYLFEVLARYDDHWTQYVPEARQVEDVDIDQKLGSMPAYSGRVRSRRRDPTPREGAFDESAYVPYQGLYHPYLEGRGIEIETAAALELGYDDREKRVTFPIRNEAGALVGVVGRRVHNLGDGKYRNYWGFDRRSALYGIHILPRDATTVVVEGPLDMVAVWQSLPDEMRSEWGVVASLGVEVTADQVEMLVQNSASVVEMFDRSKSGRQGAESLVGALCQRIRCYRFPWEDISGASDAAEMVEQGRAAEMVAGLRKAVPVWISA